MDKSITLTDNEIVTTLIALNDSLRIVTANRQYWTEKPDGGDVDMVAVYDVEIERMQELITKFTAALRMHLKF